MRKNNHLMLAYILFLFLASIIGGFLEEVRWNAIVCGATIASYFFAFSDYIYHFKNARENLQETDRQHGEMMISSAHTERIFLENLEKREINNQEFMVQTEKIHKLLDEYTKLGEQLLQDAQEKNEWYEKCGHISNFLSILGFLTFLSIAILFSSVSWLSQFQNALTVSAFAIIALTQYCRERDAQRIKAEKDYITSQRSLWQRIEENLVQEEPTHAN